MAADGLSLGALFLSAFLSSTLLPGGSEAVLAYLAHSGEGVSALLLVATAGNTLGGMTSWGLGRLIALRRPAESLAPGHARAVARLRRRGPPLLLLSWLPIVGDPLCLAAGWLRMGVLSSALFIAVGKGARYAVLLWLFA